MKERKNNTSSSDCDIADEGSPHDAEKQSEEKTQVMHMSKPFEALAVVHKYKPIACTMNSSDMPRTHSHAGASRVAS